MIKFNLIKIMRNYIVQINKSDVQGILAVKLVFTWPPSEFVCDGRHCF